MKKLILLVVLCVLSAGTVLVAQNGGSDATTSNKPKFKERLVFGGDVILSFSNRGSILGASPLLGYRVSDSYVAGVGISYIYYSYPQVSAHNYSGRVFNRLSVTEELFLHGEFEYGTFKTTTKGLRDNFSVSGNYPALLVGAGYRQSMGGTVNVGLTVLYDVIQDPNSPYGDQLIYRGGVTIGF